MTEIAHNTNKMPMVTDTAERLQQLEVLANYVRRDAFEVVRTAGSGHIGGSSSSVELFTAMYFGGRFNFDPDNPDNPNRDRILVRGHEGPVRYPIFSLLGYIDRQELWTYRRLGSRLQGHEDMHETPGVDITPSGSLGMLLSYGTGAAIAAKNQGRPNRTIVFLGDGEEQEGNVSEAARHAASLQLDNLICIVDQNTKQLSRPTAHSDGRADIAKIWEGYGWDVLEIQDGHNLQEILDTYDKLQHITKPTMVVAHTVKGYGVDGSEKHFSGYHTISCIDDRQTLDNAINRLSAKLGPEATDERMRKIGGALVSKPRAYQARAPYSGDAYNVAFTGSGNMNMEDGQSRYFAELRKRLHTGSSAAPFYMLTPDLLRSDVVSELGVEDFSHYYDTGLREQHTIGMAHGISVEDPDARIYVCYGDAFVFRAMDQMNAAAQGGGSMLVAGENAGIFQGQNGKTHQSVGQPGALLQIPEVTVYEPADVRDLYNVFSHTLSQNQGFTYVRLHRGDMTILERDSLDNKNIDAYTVHRPDKRARFIIAASGFVVENAVNAAKALEVKHGLPTTVVNVVNQKNIGRGLLPALEGDAPILTVYNGNPATLQASVSSAILATPDVPRPAFVSGHGFTGGTSGKVSELVRYYRLDTEGIADVALKSLAKHARR